MVGPPPLNKATGYSNAALVKISLLAVLVLQTAAANICARWSRVLATSPSSDAEASHGGYAKTSLVLVVECLKIVVAFGLLMWDRSDSVRDAWQHLKATTLEQPHEVLKLVVPSTLYVVQNNLLLVAAENLEGPVVAVLGQLKILTTGIFSVAILKRTLFVKQWLALVALVFGASAVQLSNSGKSAGDGGGMNVGLGVFASLAAAVTSGFAGVYFEKVLKGSEISVWVRNIHLAVWGVGAAFIGLFTQPEDWSIVRNYGIFSGFNYVVWALVLVQAFGGLLVAAVVKYTDNILKAFATSAALVLISVISVVYFGFSLEPLFILGATLVVLSMFLYGDALPACKTTKLESDSGALPKDDVEEASAPLIDGMPKG